VFLVPEEDDNVVCSEAIICQDAREVVSGCSGTVLFFGRHAIVNLSQPGSGHIRSDWQVSDGGSIGSTKQPGHLDE
jgi:hypothetical protein